MNARTAAVVVVAGLFAITAGPAAATSVASRSLEEIATDADHVLVGRVVSVDMVDVDGRPVHDPDARTAPGLRNQLRLLVEVDDVLATTCRRPPNRIHVPLWPMWWDTLGGRREQSEGSVGIFLLSGPTFSPAYPTGFQRALSDRSEVDAVVEAKRLVGPVPRRIDCLEAPLR